MERVTRRQFEHQQEQTLARLQARIPAGCPLVVERRPSEQAWREFSGFRASGPGCEMEGRAQVVAAFIDGYVAAWEQLHRYQERLQIDPGGSDAIDGLEAAVATLRELLQRREDEKRTQFADLMEIRHLCDQATGIDRSRGDTREPGALGAVRALIGRYRELLEAER